MVAHGSDPSKDSETTWIEPSPYVLGFVQDTQMFFILWSQKGMWKVLGDFPYSLNFFFCMIFCSNIFLSYMAIVLSLTSNDFHLRYAEIYLQDLRLERLETQLAL